MMAAMLCACAADSAPPSAPSVETVPIDASLVDTVLVAGGPLRIDVRGAGVLVPLRAMVGAQGAVDGTSLPEERVLEGEFETSEQGVLQVSVPWERLSQELGLDTNGTFQGRLTVVVEDLGKLLEGVDVIDDATVQVLSLIHI